MKQSLCTSIYIGTALFLSGCVPKVHTTVPAIEGKIIDKDTKAPIEGIVLSKNIQTDIKGHFILPAKTELGIGTPMGGLWYISRSFIIRKEGYHSLRCICEVLNNNADCTDVVISMSKEGSSCNPNHNIQSSMLQCTPFLPKMQTL